MADEKQVIYTVNANIPTCTISAYAASCGVSVEVVKGWIKRDYIPVHRIGKYTFINLAAFTEKLKNTP